MVIKDLEKIKELQSVNKQIRNICILAHVDHGKTTLADSLISSNGIISQRQAGKLRYLDNRPDEQDRQITMKCSNIALYYKTLASNQEFLINLIDSPGHVDFSSEVSAAIRLCDGAIVVVDAVEGVCAQTRICLKQAYDQHLKTVLVLNKIDRLIFEKRMNTEDAYKHLQRVLEQVNAVMGNIFASDVLAKDVTDNQQSALEDFDDSCLYFDPKVGNVVFGSALDGWGFTLRNFAKQYESKLGVDAKQLTECLWGDFYYNSKKKSCEKGAFNKGKKTLFVQLVLDNIWNVYETIERKETDKIQMICDKLEVNYKIQKYVDPKIPIKSIFSQWLPLDHAIFQMVINHTPDPSQMSLNKIQDLVSAMKPENSKSYSKETQVLMNDLKTCDNQSDNVIVFVSKMFPIPFKLLEMSDKSVKNEDNEFAADDEVLIGFARVFSGVLKSNSEIYVLGSKYDPRLVASGVEEAPYLTKVKIGSIYVLMGKNLEPIEEAHAGNVVGIGGLHKHVIKTATLTNNLYCPSFNDLPILATPILRVAIEAANMQEMPILLKGLKLLNQVDPCVQVLIQDTGEHVLLALGEVHLEKCITDLKESFAKIEINVSKPIVPFKETIVTFTNPIVQPDVPAASTVPDNEDKSITIQTSNKNSTIKILALPLPASIVETLEKNKEMLKLFVEKNEPLSNHFKDVLKDVESELEDTLKKEFDGAYNVKHIWSLGPKKNPTCLLLNLTGYQHNELFASTPVPVGSDVRCNYENAFTNGFQSAVQIGPLCHEPMHGVCFVVQEWKIEDETQFDGILSGQIITAVKEGCRRSFQVQPQRLVAPMYNCNIIVNSNVLGKLYAVIGRRNGKVISADMIEGSGQFSVEAIIPVIESFDLANEIRIKTSGLAMPQLSFSHWEVIDMDPFWIPTTEEEYEQFGEKADFVNKAKVYMDSIRERKGLYVDKKLVEFAEKQRTLSKNK